MNFINYYGKRVNVLHAQGFAHLDMCILSLSHNKATLPPNLTVIIIDNNELLSLAAYKLKLDGIPYINGFYTTPQHPNFCMTMKIDYTLNALELVKTDYVLYLDSRDAVIDNFDDIIENFEYYNMPFIWGGDANNYPNRIWIDYEINLMRDYPTASFINSGVFMAKTKEAIRIYKKYKQIRETIGVDTFVMSHCGHVHDCGDLALVRYYFDFVKGQGIDYEQRIFMCLCTQTRFIIGNNMYFNKSHCPDDNLITTLRDRLLECSIFSKG